MDKNILFLLMAVVFAVAACEPIRDAPPDPPALEEHVWIEEPESGIGNDEDEPALEFNDHDPTPFVWVERTGAMVFTGPDGEVGSLYWEDGRLHFVGDVDATAEVFFETFWKTHVVQDEEPCL